MSRQTWDSGESPRDGGAEDGFVPLTAEQAQQWRATHPPLPVWSVLLVQALVGMVLVGLLGLLWPNRLQLAASALYGVLTAWVPALVFARAELRRRRRAGSALGALTALLVWEGVKIVLTVALLLAAPKVLAVVHWPALVAGFVLTLKAAWLALAWLSMRRRQGEGF